VDKTPLKAAVDRPEVGSLILVFVCDQQPLVRAGLRSVLEQEPDIKVAGEFSNGYKALAAVQQLHPRVVLTDIRLPGLNGVELARRITNAHIVLQSVQVIVLVEAEKSETLIRAIRAGARAILVKTDPPSDFIRAIRAVAVGDAMLAPPIAGLVLDRFASQVPAPETESLAMLSRLSKRELEVLRLLAEGQSTPQIAAALSINETTVKSHVHHLLQKLALRDRCQAVAFAYKFGWVRSIWPDLRAAKQGPPPIGGTKGAGATQG
jgi:DNA-binding NarL/FixJ family response regulator